jgi:hypothetical protein
MKDEMDNQNVVWQLTPVDMHLRNLAERAIETFKNHFLAGLASTDDDFPYTPMVPPPPSGPAHPKSTPNIPDQPTAIGGGPAKWPIRL